MAEKKKSSILVVEDEKPMANALRVKLTNEGFDVELANNGREALEKIEAGSFDLILMDLIMPDMNGFDTLQAFKEKGIKIPVIISSNLAQPDDEAKARELGAVDFLVKSNTSINDVVKRVKSVL